MTKDLTKKIGSFNIEYCRYAGSRERKDADFIHQTNTCKIYKCDNKTKGQKPSIELNTWILFFYIITDILANLF